MGWQRKSEKLTFQLILNAISVVSRLLAGVVVFVVMAKYMGPTAFGEFMYAMSVAALVAFPAALGFGQQVLREVAANPTNVDTIVSEVSSAKISLIILVLAAVGVVCVANPAHWLLIALLTWTSICDSFSEYIFCVLRARGRYAGEAVFMTLASTLHFVFVLAGLNIGVAPIEVATVFALSKGIQCVAVIVFFRGFLGKFNLKAAPVRQWTQIRNGLPYTGDVALAVLSGQIDTILIKHALGAQAAGLYQSGMRLVVGLQNFSVVAGNVFIPRLAAVHRNPAVFLQTVKKANLTFFSLGLVLAAILGGGGWLLVQYGYGSEYESVKHLLPWLCLLVAMRLFAASYGVQLTALGDQRYRTIVNFICLFILMFALWFGAYAFGLEGAVVALVLVISLIFLAYFLRAQKLRASFVWASRHEHNE